MTPITTRHLVGEVVATAGLIAVIFSRARTGRAALSAVAVGAYIGAAYWFTSSTSFANPAVTVGRTPTPLTGIAPGSAPGFIAAQIIGGFLGLALIAVLYPDAAATVEPCRHPAAHRNPSRRSTECDMTDSPVPLATHHHPDLSSGGIDTASASNGMRLVREDIAQRVEDLLERMASR